MTEAWPFGDLERVVAGQTILARAPSKNGFRRALVRCVCGHERELSLSSFLRRPAVCTNCARSAQTGPKAGNWKGGKHTPLTTYHKFKRSALRRKIPWDLSIEDLDALFEKQRGLCGLSLEPLCWDHGVNGVKGNASLDRVDSAKGYTLDNVQLVTKKLNIAKQSVGRVEFVEMCFAVTNAHLE